MQKCLQFTDLEIIQIDMIHEFFDIGSDDATACLLCKWIYRNLGISITKRKTINKRNRKTW